jgi:hypothetical protein
MRPHRAIVKLGVDDPDIFGIQAPVVIVIYNDPAEHVILLSFESKNFAMLSA